jgi:gliding motility protein gldF
MVWQLGMPKGNMDMASTIGSYIALFLLGATFVAVGMLSSALSQSQIIAFVIATFLNFFLFFGLDEIIALFSDNLLFSVGFKAHFEDISRGVIDTRNILYFLCITFFFLYVTQLFLQAEKK